MELKEIQSPAFYKDRWLILFPLCARKGKEFWKIRLHELEDGINKHEHENIRLGKIEALKVLLNTKE